MNRSQIAALANSVAPFVLQARRHIHANPELSYQEEQTAAYVAAQLREMGYEPETNIGGLHAVKAVLTGGKPGPRIGLRADMDALPITELNELAFKSQNPGVMHACGHDCHTSMLLGAAKALKQVQEQVAGSVVFLFQPAEEVGPGGAQFMVKAGALEGLDAVFALHIGPGMDAGTIGFMEGVSSANSDALKITVTGKGGHAAHPHTTVDAVVVAGHVIVALQQVVARQVGPTESAVVTIGAVHGGTKGNIIAEQVELVGTVRTLDAKVRAEMPGRLERLVNGVCEAFGATGAVEYRPGYPSVVNDAAMVALSRQAAALAVGPENVEETKVSLGGEDFSYMAQAAPGAMGRLGSGSPAVPAGERYPLHNARMLVDEQSLNHGVAFWVALALLAGAEGSPLR
jgi:amidohydrolase